MNIRNYYVSKFPTDDLGNGINPKATFAGLLNQLFIGGDVYEYLYVYDSIVRERVFEQLAEQLGLGYEYVYKLWLK